MLLLLLNESTITYCHWLTAFFFLCLFAFQFFSLLAIVLHNFYSCKKRFFPSWNDIQRNENFVTLVDVNFSHPQMYEEYFVMLFSQIVNVFLLIQSRFNRSPLVILHRFHHSIFILIRCYSWFSLTSQSEYGRIF